MSEPIAILPMKADRHGVGFLFNDPVPISDAVKRVFRFADEIMPSLVKPPMMYRTRYFVTEEENNGQSLVAVCVDQYDCNPDPLRPHATANFSILSQEFNLSDDQMDRIIRLRASIAIDSLSRLVRANNKPKLEEA